MGCNPSAMMEKENPYDCFQGAVDYRSVVDGTPMLISLNVLEEICHRNARAC